MFCSVYYNVHSKIPHLPKLPHFTFMELLTVINYMVNLHTVKDSYHSYPLPVNVLYHYSYDSDFVWLQPYNSGHSGIKSTVSTES